MKTYTHQEILDRMASIAPPTRNFLTDEQKRERDQRVGAKILKRELLGFWRVRGTRTLDEVASALYRTDIVQSIEEGREIVPNLDGFRASYGGILYDVLSFEEVKNHQGDIRYEIGLYTINPNIPI